MITFWIAAALLSVLVALPILAGAARGAKVGPADEDPTLALHRRQLAEIDDLAARGLMSEDDSRIARAEAGRRLLAAADAAAPVENTVKVRRLALSIAVAAPLLAVIAYIFVGSPSLPDQPFNTRLKSWFAADPATLQPDQIVAMLESRKVEQKNDPQFWRFLGLARARAGDAAGAAEALRSAVRLDPQRADLWLQLGQALVMVANDTVADDALAAFREADRLDPGLPAANYFIGRRMITDGQTAEGVARWRAILPNMPEAARPALQQEIDTVQATGRLPGAVDAAAAQAQGQGQQVSGAQITAMVESLAARLKQSPDDPEGWVRLVRAYTVMGETAKRDAALAEARARFKDRPEVLQGLDSAAQPAQR